MLIALQHIRYVSLLLIFLCLPNAHAITDKSPFYLALIAPLTGNFADGGQGMLNAVQLYLDKVNAANGVNGHPLKLLTYDSQGDPDIGMREAKKLVQDERIYAVLGHYFSTVAIRTNEVYGAAEIPAISSGAAANQVIEGYDWFFMINPSTKTQAITLAHSIVHLAHLDQVAVVFEPKDTFSRTINTMFQEAFQSLNGHIINAWELNAEISDAKAFAVLAYNVRQTLEGDNSSLIVIPLIEPKAAQMVIALRRQGVSNPILTTVGSVFLRDLKMTPEEKSRPGYFSEGIYLASGLLFDIAGQEAQEFRQNYRKRFKQEPSSNSAFAYDGAKLVVEALMAIDAEGQDIKAERTQLRQYLADILSPEQGIDGITGLTYFNPGGYAMKPPNLGVIKNQNIISASTQFKPVANPKLLHNLKEEIKNNNIIEMDGEYVYKTNISYTNFEMINMSDIDVKKHTALLEFYLWFGYQDDIDPTQIEFLNAVEQIELGEPIEKVNQGHYAYSFYRVKGHFYIDFLPQYHDEYALDQSIVGVQFQHKHLPSNRLIYVKDLRSSPTSSKGAREQIARNLAQFSRQWEIRKIRTYQDIISKPARGNPSYEEYGDTVNFSRFNQFRLIKHKQFNLRRQMSSVFAQQVLLYTIFAFLVLTIVRHAYYQDCSLSKNAKIAWALQLPILCAFLIAMESVVLTSFWDGDTSSLQAIHAAFDIVWWLLPAYFLTQGIKRFVWGPIEKRTGSPVPPLMRGITTFIIYMLAIFGVIAFVFEMKITSLLATSGMFAMIIGLAVQMNISNIFSGIAINVDRPFRIGDWIKIGNYPIGKVLDITWRATRIQTGGGDILSIPNAVAADTTVYNYHYPTDICLLSQKLYIDFQHPPHEMKQLIQEAMLSVKDVLKDPPPGVNFCIGEWANEYSASFRVHDYGNNARLRTEVNEAIYASLLKTNVTPARPPLLK